MKQPRGVFVFLAFLMASSCFAYEVVLKNGKVLSGEVLSEDQELLVLRDSTGVKLHIKKSSIDSVKTVERNPEVEPVPPPASEPEPVPEPQKSMIEKPKPKARVYKKEDLEKLPELSIIGDENEETPDEEALRKELENEAMQEKEMEAAWNEKALRIDDQIQQAREAVEYNQSYCDKVIPDMNDLRDGPYVVMSAEQYEEQRRIACMEAEAAVKDLKRAEAEYEAFQEEARKKGIPPGWVDADRLRD